MSADAEHELEALVRARLSTARERTKQLSEELERSWEHVRAQRERLGTLDRERAELDREVEEMRGTVAATRSELGLREAELAELRARLAAERADGERAAHERQRLGRALEQAREDIEAIGASRAWRLGHGLMRRLRLSAPVTPGRVHVALDRLEEVIPRTRAPAPATQLGRGDAPVPAPAEAPAHAPEPVPTPVETGSAATAAELAREEFRRLYAQFVPATDEAERARPSILDRRGLLADPKSQPSPSVDVVICVHDAADDLRRCVWSLLERTDRRFRLILVDDGSGPAAAELARRIAAENRGGVVHIRRDEPPHGYTLAANAGLRAADADWIVLLNSDTLVTPGWLDRLCAAGDSDPSIAIVGPLSNAATHQSVPSKRDEQGWATNPLPVSATEDAVASIVATASNRRRPLVPFVNGFCFAIRRRALEQIGFLDDERFASGYCEESDLCIRAQDAGWTLAIADDAYVFHAKSRSFTPERRAELARRNYAILLEKHGERRVGELVAVHEADPSLDPLRARVARSLEIPDLSVEDLDQGRSALSVVFVLPSLSRGGSGGSHSVYQEVKAMRRLGVDARIALAASAWQHAEAAYADASEVFFTYDDPGELAAGIEAADVVSATHFLSVELLAELVADRPDVLPAYYVQDFEPLFHDPSSPSHLAAVRSYSRLPSLLLFAKTHWLCNLVWDALRVPVAKVEPSIDTDVFHGRGRSEVGEPVRVTAMVRPRTPRRQAHTTVAVLDRLRERFGSGVEVTTFGCTTEALRAVGASRELADRHAGLLQREHVADLLRRSDVFLDCSIYQAFGRTALEAMACGCVPVVPKMGGATEFAVPGHNSVAADTMDPGAVLQALGDLVRDPAAIAANRAAALETAGRYSASRAAVSEYVLFRRAHERMTGARG